MTVGSLFAGIGGMDLGFERVGMEVRWQVEIDGFCNKVLEKHWPDVKRWKDVKDCGRHNLEKVDLICGGFPCQSFSVAGKRKGKADDRWLWPEMLRIVREIGPDWVFGENVVGIVGMALDDVLSDLEGLGYSVQTFVVPACVVNAPHRRDRVWIVADSGGIRGTRKAADETDGCSRVVGGEDSKIFQENRARQTGNFGTNSKWAIEPDVGRVVDGISTRLDEDRLSALGNAVVLQVVEVFGRAIMETERAHGQGR